MGGQQGRATCGLRFIVGIIVLLATTIAVSAQQPDFLSETYSAWTVTCIQGDESERQCAMSQALQADDNGGRLLLTELRIEDDETSMVMVTPFGLNVAVGASISTDGDEPWLLPFFTCYQNGCLLRTSLSGDTLGAFRRGATLSANFTIAETNEPFSLSVSLAGFSSAYNRLETVSK